MQGFSIDSERVASAGAGVGDVAGRLGVEITAMRQMLADIQHGWRSSVAAPRFATVMTAHLDQVTALREALVSHGTALTTSAQKFDAAETALAGAFGAGR